MTGWNNMPSFAAKIFLIFAFLQEISCETNVCASDSECGKNVSQWKMFSDRCNIPRVVNITNEEFLFNYAFKMPVIVQNASDNSLFQQMCDKDKLLSEYGNKTITLSTANTHSYDKVDITFTEYMNRILAPQDYNKSGQDTLYFFGNHDYEEWKDLFKHYVLPPYNLPGKSPALSFGIAGAGTGVPFHFHGPGFAEVIRGRKRWFLTPYELKPTFDPNKTTLRWLMEEYKNIESNEDFFECVLQSNEVLYFPDRWWHATLNIEDAVFMSTFLA